MDAATTKQKTFIRDLFVRCGVPKWIFNPLKFWNICKDDADLLIKSLKIMKDFDHEELKDAIWQNLESRNAFHKTTKTLDEIEEEPDIPNPNYEDLIDQHICNDLSQREYIDDLPYNVIHIPEVIE